MALNLILAVYENSPVLPAAVARANLRIFRDECVVDRLQPLIIRMKSGLAERIAAHPHVADIRQWGMMAGIELMKDPSAKRAYPNERLTGAQVAKAARKSGVLMRPLGDVMVFVPPLSISANEIDLMLDATLEAIKRSHRRSVQGVIHHGGEASIPDHWNRYRRSSSMWHSVAFV